MSVLQRKELEGSPLADLHAIASELGIEGYRALRKDDLIKSLLDASGSVGDDDAAHDWDDEGLDDAPDEGDGPDAELDDAPPAGSNGDDLPHPDLEPEREADPIDEPEPDPEPQPDAEPATGILDVLPNGSGFLRVGAGDQPAADVYVSPAQIRRCELRAGDEVAGPLRPARRNERHPSLVRIETVNGGAAEPPEQRPRFADLTAVHPTDKLAVPASLASVPFGKGSRVAIAGAPGSGQSRLLGEIAAAISAAHADVTLSVVLVGVRPEEITGWQREGNLTAGGASFDRPSDAQAQAAELAVERAKRTVERGGDTVVLIDTLEALPQGVARRLFGAARKAEEGGSLTIVATVGSAAEPLRQASTRITLDAAASEPTVLAPRSGTQRPDLLG